MSQNLHNAIINLKALHREYADAGEHDNAGIVEMLWGELMRMPGAQEINQQIEGAGQ